MAGPSGVLLVDKPAGPSSRQVLDALQARLGAGPLGHAGTLDPLASGLLVALAGRARRLQELLLSRDKTYVARIRFGATSRTLDAEGPVASTGVEPVPIPPDAIQEILARFEGESDQAPPEFSAIRVGGRRAHRLARRGRPVALPPRRVRIDALRLLRVEEPDWIVQIACGPGVYVRSLARDVGEARGCGAYLAELRRTRSGSLRVEDAVPPGAATSAHLRPLTEILRDEPRIDVTPGEARALRAGDVISRPLPGIALPVFAWFGGRPCFRLTRGREGLARSDLMIDEPGYDPPSARAAEQGEDEPGEGRDRERLPAGESS